MRLQTGTWSDPRSVFEHALEAGKLPNEVCVRLGGDGRRDARRLREPDANAGSPADDPALPVATQAQLIGG